MKKMKTLALAVVLCSLASATVLAGKYDGIETGTMSTQDENVRVAQVHVPDAGATAALLGGAIGLLWVGRRILKSK